MHSNKFITFAFRNGAMQPHKLFDKTKKIFFLPKYRQLEEWAGSVSHTDFVSFPI